MTLIDAARAALTDEVIDDLGGTWPNREVVRQKILRALKPVLESAHRELAEWQVRAQRQYDENVSQIARQAELEARIASLVRFTEAVVDVASVPPDIRSVPQVECPRSPRGYHEYFGGDHHCCWWCGARQEEGQGTA